MTRMSTNTRELSITQLLVLAARTARIMSMEQVPQGAQWNARAAYGRDQLELILDKMPADGSMVRDIEVTLIDIVAGTQDYVLDADTVDVRGHGMFRKTGEDVGSTVSQIDREAYLATPDRTLQTTPSRFWVDRGASVTLRLTEVPADAGTLEVARQVLLADSSDGNATPDVERYWFDHLHYELATRFARAAGMPISEVKDLQDQANHCRDVAQTKSRQQTENQMVVDHPTPWS